jgi:hypothetical protein
MKVYVPDHIIKTAKELSKNKTPAKRTKGFDEQPGQKRGDGDLSDTVACFTLFSYFTGTLKIPTIYPITALQGDLTDLLITVGSSTKSINVKASNYQYKDHDEPEKCCHLAIKESEFDKLDDLYIQIMTHLSPANDNPHIHFCGGIARKDLDFSKKEEIPNTGGTFGLWIPAKRLKPIHNLIKDIQ